MNPVNGETRIFYSNEISPDLHDRNVHPFRVEVNMMQQLIRAGQDRILGEDQDFEEARQPHHLLAYLHRRHSSLDVLQELAE